MEKHLDRRSLLKGALASAAGLAGASLVGQSRQVSSDGNVLQKRATVPLVAADWLAGDPSTLRGWAQKANVEFGVSPSGQGWNDIGFADAYQKLITQQFNLLAFGNFEWSHIHPRRDAYDYNNSFTDWAATLARTNGMGLQAYHLVASGGVPDWLLSGNFARAELLDILKDHISTVVQRYKGRVQTWSVVNEHIGRRLFQANLLRGNFWYMMLGDDYVPLAFQWAREADPSATLILNENHNEGRRTDVTEGCYELVRSLKVQNVPIDGVGMQMHFLINDPTEQVRVTKRSVTDLMDKYLQLGLKVFVTEFDVDLRNVRGTDAERFAVQAEVYRDMLGAALESGACKSFSVFTPGDKYSWLVVPAPGVNTAPNAAPTPWDMNLKPKPAYDAMTQVLRSYGGS